MNWLAWIALAVVILSVGVWLVGRFRTESRRIDGILSDFDREHPRREPGSPTRRLAGLLRRR